MLRTTTATLLAAGAISALFLTTPVAGASPLVAGNTKCSEFLVMKASEQKAVIDEILSAKASSPYATKPYTLVSKVGAKCRTASYSNMSLRTVVLAVEKDAPGAPAAPAVPSSSSGGSTPCAVWLKMKRPDQAQLLQELLPASNKFKIEGRFNTAAALLDGHCGKVSGSTPISTVLPALNR